MRHRDGLPELLVVTARRNREHWVLPKGHLEPGEDPAAAAVREVREESGVIAEVRAPLDDTVIELGGEHQRVRWFLMEASDQTDADELREVVWLDPPAALARLSFPDARTVAEHALTALAATAEDSP